ncbi:FKBP-type peptidyl-prolyl cis-trans isomerase [Hymenobacter sp. BT683]|uniref:Peptidyl-prolyl cis-trans isomerase n=1 Tax=Hymenobacter jeongseonensis TaxID=2791027 RepID=A0ABS0IKH0_9BACT|nr:FKBP-type peptidyl-prolyl cis-trans isomerase [Hymenobacter jeongseonensis]MBF9238876.1 FKBP-type peptidyl-prolyl cis-trans isomerase [Hymenobacter jeongseonensis]
MKHSIYTVFNRFFLLLFLATTGLFAASCTKDDPEVVDYSGIDDNLIKKYLTDNSITTAQKQPSGLYFRPITTNANGVKITPGTTVSVLYTGRLLDAAGTVFDATSLRANTPINFVVGAGRLIPGFEEGIALMHIGDKAELIIPSGLAYGSRANGNIPANSVVRFEVEVLDYKAIDDALITKYFVDKNVTTAQKQPSGIYFLPITTNPTALKPTVGSLVSVLYTGRFLDANGTVFDASSQNGNTPLSFRIGGNSVIKGFEEAITLMHKGDKAEVFIPSSQAYGPAGAGTSIAPNTVLRFELELVDVR